MRQVVYQPGTYPGFLWHEETEHFYSPLDGMLVHHRVTPSIKLASTHFILYAWVEREALRE